MPELAIAIFVAVFAVATLRNIHLGVLMLPAAAAVGVWLAGMSMKEVLVGWIGGTPPDAEIKGGFPVNILVLIGGVTYFFGIAQANGTIDAVIQKVIAAVGDRRALQPFLFFLITAGVASMGSSQAGYVMIPLAMAAARRSAVDPLVMGVALNSGMSAGGFAPTSLFGAITFETAQRAGIDLNRFVLLAAAVVANLALLCVAAWMFSRPRSVIAPLDSAIDPAAPAGGSRFATHQVVTLACIVILILTVVTGYLLLVVDEKLGTSLGFQPDIGLTAFGLGAVLAWLWPKSGAEGMRRIDWSTIFMVGGIVTFVGVLQHMKVDDLLGQAALNVGTPLVRAFLVCVIAGLVSAFASTTAILALLATLAAPLATQGDVAGWALMIALGVCASIVDASPYSTTGALILASAAEGERPRLKSLLMRWGLSMVVVGPVAAVIVLALLGAPSGR